ncbi:hypothetical protein RDn1_321, partial [Candidatus Termititenax dinenymphae]
SQSLSGQWSAAFDKILASGVINAISKHVDIVIQAYKTLTRVIEDDKKAGRVTDQRIIEAHKEFEQAIMSIAEKIIDGAATWADFQIRSREADDYYTTNPALADLTPLEIVTKGNQLTKEVNALAGKLDLLKPETMLEVFDKLKDGPEKDKLLRLLETKLKDLPVDRLLELSKNHSISGQLKEIIDKVLQDKLEKMGEGEKVSRGKQASSLKVA